MNAMSRMILPLALTSLPLAAHALPFATSNQAALAQGFDLPAVGHAAVLGAGKASSQFSLDLSSEYSAHTAGSETIVLDGETARLAWRYRQGMDGWDWGVELPVVHAGGGFLDSFIEDWHDFFGLPNGGREFAPQDRYLYQYDRGGSTRLQRTEEGWALGDLRVSAGWALNESLALRGELKLPTGDDDQLSGGNLGAAAWGDWALPFDLDSRWSGFVSAGLSANQKGDVLEDQQETLVPFGGAGLFFRAWRQVELGTQFNLHGPLYDDSELDELSRAGGQLVFGGRWLGAGWALDLAVQEDILTRSSPDFGVHIGLRLLAE
ncbi:MAG TPA: DUF3187 family protein [Solimonas sp.]|nr:DUF3187 family protein [Solimonas sp.]